MPVPAPEPEKIVFYLTEEQLHAFRRHVTAALVHVLRVKRNPEEGRKIYKKQKSGNSVKLSGCSRAARLL